ncbi:fatty acid desaturase [Woodsholea maritima]|uniref:fatty acid desaturase n=1 Tax=Woodsholea maritima TaxID=240237 RepID=UPI000475DA0E|nr:fatty acid desaturase [Woodsholea maritima]
MLHQLALALILFAIGGMAWVTWGIFVRVSASIFMHWAISYLAHTRGPSDWAVKDASVQGHNIAWLAIPTMGESWHGNHHAFPTSARHGLYPGQIDPGWWVIQGLEALNLVWDVQTPTTLPPRSNLIALTERARNFQGKKSPL